MDTKHPSNRTGLEDLVEVFGYHRPTAEQATSYGMIRAAGWELAETILRHCPPCADTTAAIRKIREAVMTANAAIALDPAAKR